MPSRASILRPSDSLASLSAASLPSIPQWLGIQQNFTWVPLSLSLKNTQWCTLWSVLTLDVLHKIPVQQCHNSSNFCRNCFISSKLPMNVMTSSYNTRLSVTLSPSIIRMNSGVSGYEMIHWIRYILITCKTSQNSDSPVHSPNGCSYSHMDNLVLKGTFSQ